MEGWLTKRGHIVTNWKQRYFRLKGDKLIYYKDEQTDKPQGEIHLVNSTLEPITSSRFFMWKIHQTQPKKKVFPIRAESEEQLRKWFDALSPFCAMLNASLAHHDDENESPLEKAMRLFDKAVKARPVDAPTVVSSLGELFAMILRWESEEPFAQMDALEDPEFNQYLDMVKEMHVDAWRVMTQPENAGSLAKNQALYGDLRKLYGDTLKHCCTYRWQVYNKAKGYKELADDATRTLLESWKDGMMAMVLLTPPDVQFLEMFKQVCQATAADSKHFVGDAAVVAKRVAGDIPAIIKAADRLGDAVCFGFMSKKGDGLMGGWKRRFFVLDNKSLRWYPGASASDKLIRTVLLNTVEDTGDSDAAKRNAFSVSIGFGKSFELDPGYGTWALYWRSEILRLAKAAHE